MTVNRWLLPEGVEEILPKQAAQIEAFRRAVLDMYQGYGYCLVIPPLIEYTESLLINSGSDMDLQTFKVTDQLSGRMMAIRADITPQTARIDAHSLKEAGPTRLCYAGTVLQTKPKSQLASRIPLEVGAELYGEASLYADIEVIELMLATIGLASNKTAHLDIGHVGIYRSLIEASGIDAQIEKALDDAFDRKAKAEVEALVAKHCADVDIAQMITALVDLHGDRSVLEKAKQQLAKAPQAVQQALADLQVLSEQLSAKFPNTPVFFDLVELRGYQYHTGLVFAAYLPGVGHAVANGGRYDGIGEAFGRARPATGFSANIQAMLGYVEPKTKEVILAPIENDVEKAQSLQKSIKQLRDSGKVVIQALPESKSPAVCSSVLEHCDGSWQIKPLNNQ